MNRRKFFASLAGATVVLAAPAGAATVHWQKATFLRALEDMPLFGPAYQAANLSPETFQKWWDESPVWREQVTTALETGIDRVEAAALRRALDRGDFVGKLPA